MRISDWSSDVCSSDLRVRIGEARPRGGERGEARVCKAETAERIGEIEVDLGLVAAQPVERGARGFERRIQRRDQPGGVAARRNMVDRDRPRENETVEPVAMIESGRATV